MLDSVKTQALSIAENFFDDHETFTVYYVPGVEDVRLVAVSDSFESLHEVIPIRFLGHPERLFSWELPDGVPADASWNDRYPLDTTVVLLSSKDFESVKNDDLDLPDGWDYLEAIASSDKS